MEHDIPSILEELRNLMTSRDPFHLNIAGIAHIHALIDLLEGKYEELEAELEREMDRR